ncbi:MAG: LysR family transcriptional regulator [Betaproteobacteria bacterium]|nr:LysR family transcriptional regulator [Betaproteobacteria bacterium]
MKPPKSSLEQWAVLAAVVDEGGYAQAAAALHRSQPAVSYAVARLQEALNVPLLAIEGRKAVLTPIGKALLKRARSLLRDWDTLERVALSLTQGWEPELKLVVDHAFPRQRLLAILGKMQKACPNTQLQFTAAVLSGAEEAIVEGTADVVLTTRVPTGFLGEWLLDMPFMIAAHRDHPLFELGRSVTADDLARHTQVVIRDTGVRRPRDEGWLGSTVRWTVGSMDAALAVLRAGLAYGWLPEHIIEPSLKDRTLQRIPLAFGAERKVPVYMVLTHPDSAGPAARAAVELFQRHVLAPPQSASH